MIYSDFTYNNITFSRFARTSGYQAEAISGDRIQIRSTRDPLPSQNGIQRYIDFYGSRLLEIRGFVKGSSESDLYTKIQSLITAFDIKNLEAAASSNYGFSPLQWTDPGQAIARYYVKPINNTLVVQEARTGLARQFSVLLEAKDPVKYSATQTLYTITPTAAGSSSAFSFRFPVAFASSTASGSTTVVNSGSNQIYPVSIIFYGPSSGSWTGAKITNSTTGKFLGLNSSFGIGVGESVRFNPSVGTALYYLSNGSYSDITAQITASSTYWKLAVGNNTILVEGNSFPATAYATIDVIQSF